MGSRPRCEFHESTFQESEFHGELLADQAESSCSHVGACLQDEADAALAIIDGLHGSCEGFAFSTGLLELDISPTNALGFAGGCEGS